MKIWFKFSFHLTLFLFFTNKICLGDFQNEIGDKSVHNTLQDITYSSDIANSLAELYNDKIGLFIHWGPYSQLGGIWEDKKGSEWIMRNAKIPVLEYENEAAKKFLPVKFDPKEWVNLCIDAGMRFIVITAKHHDGFAMFDSRNPYNIKNFGGFGRDPLAELHVECVNKDIKLGFYYSQSQDWHEKGGDGNSWQGWPKLTKESFEVYYRDKVLLQIEELLTKFKPLSMLWFDTPGQFMSSDIIEETIMLIEKHQPQVLINSRIGGGYGHFETAVDNGLMPCVNTNNWKDGLKIPWQTHSCVSGLWGYASYLKNIHTNQHRSANRFIYELADIVSKGGVLLLNVAPDELGVIPIGQANLLRRLGKWLKINSDSIYNADPSPLRNPDLPITMKPGKLFFHIKEDISPNVIIKGIKTKFNRLYLLDESLSHQISFEQKNKSVHFKLPKSLYRDAQGHIVVVAEFDKELLIYDETIIANSSGLIKLPVSKCKYNRTSFSYDSFYQCTHKIARSWDNGGNTLE